MRRQSLAKLLYAALAALYVLHNDLWLWNDSRLWLGLPAGLVYHIGFCVAVSAVLALVVTLTWPLPWVEGAAASPPAGGPAGQGEAR